MVLSISFRAIEFEKSQNASARNSVQIRKIMRHVIDFGTFRRERISDSCRRKKFSTQEIVQPRSLNLQLRKEAVRTTIMRNSRDQYLVIPLFIRKCATKNQTFVFSTAGTVLFQNYTAFRIAIVPAKRPRGLRLKFLYLSLQTQKQHHFSKMYTCWQHWRKEGLDTSGTNGDQYSACT